MNETEKKRLFLDMDGTLARFHDQVNYLERMFEKDFFRDLEPFENMVAGVRRFIQNNPDVEVYILSARVIGEPPYCEEEKNLWLDIHLPEVDRAHRIYTDMGVSKASYIPGGVGKNDYLLDDYNKGLNLWLYDGGSAIKCHNNINQKGLGAYGGSAGALWAGPMVHTDDNPELIAAELAQHMDIAYDLNKVLSAREEQTQYSELKPGSLVRFSPDPFSPGITNYLLKRADHSPYRPLTYEATRTSKDFREHHTYTFQNPLNAVRFLEGKDEFIELHMNTSSGVHLSIPRFAADALASNLYEVKDALELADESHLFPRDVADAFELGLENAKKPIVGHVHYLGCNGEVGETAIFRDIQDMKDEIEDCRDCGCPIAVDWCVPLKKTAVKVKTVKSSLEKQIQTAAGKKDETEKAPGTSPIR